ncbi:MAG: MFS transporter [Myxococcota bacterium]
MPQRSRYARWVYLGALMLAGESIYMLPYMRKTFQTSMEETFAVTGAELGTVNGMFGILALACYFPGGWLADRFPARHLLTISLVSTGLGGSYMMTFPGYVGLLALHAFWGVTSILTFWGALIKATREWGDAHEQGLGFGALDGGRGVVAALLATLATYGFTLGATAEAKLQAVLWVYSLAPMVAGLLVWLVVPNRLGVERAQHRGGHGSGGELPRPAAARLKSALRRPEVWLLAVVIFASYWLYVGSFAFPAFAERAHGEDESFGAVLGTFRDWFRPVSAVGAGLLADRFRSSRVIAAAFVLLGMTFASLWLVPPAAGGIGLLWVQVGVVAVAVFALRGIYYALMEESGIPRTLTGTTVGIVSVVGFMPDTFAFVVSARFAEGAPGGAGYPAYFGLLSGVAVMGLMATGAIAVRRRS